jgi:hypothetical protein
MAPELHPAPRKESLFAAELRWRARLQGAINFGSLPARDDIFTAISRESEAAQHLGLSVVPPNGACETNSVEMVSASNERKWRLEGRCNQSHQTAGIICARPHAPDAA